MPTYISDPICCDGANLNRNFGFKILVMKKGPRLLRSYIVWMALTKVSPCKHHEAGISWTPFARASGKAWLLPTHPSGGACKLAVPFKFRNWHASAMVQPCTNRIHWDWTFCQSSWCMTWAVFHFLPILLFSDFGTRFSQLFASDEEGHRMSNTLHLLDARLTPICMKWQVKSEQIYLWWTTF